MRTILLTLCFAGALSAACTSPGKERWAIKTSVPDGSGVQSGTPVSLADLENLGNPPGVHNKDARYDAALIPRFDNAKNLKEGDMVTLEGYFYLVATESNDCEYHMQITAEPPPATPGNCVIVEVARPDAFSSDVLQKTSAAVRDTVRTKFLGGAEPSGTEHGNVMKSAIYVRVTGQLFYDDAHLEKDGTPQPRGKAGVSSHTLWELHPVTALQVLPAPK